MKTRQSLLIALILALNGIWIGCSNNVENPGVDCSQSDLSVSIVDQTTASCDTPGSITVEAAGGTPAYSYSSDGVEFQTSATLGGLSAGSITITVRDADGCTRSLDTILEGDPSTVVLQLSIVEADCGEANGSITANASGGVPPYLYSLDGGAQQSSNVFNGVENGVHTVTAEDSDQCEATQSIGAGTSLSADVMPIISANCAVTGCHNGTRSPDLRTTSGVINSASRVKARTSSETMPPSDRDPLTQAQIEIIACWVDEGAQDN